jgi:hypothetical protein
VVVVVVVLLLLLLTPRQAAAGWRARLRSCGQLELTSTVRHGAKAPAGFEGMWLYH